jgi:hypothetical protein
MNIIIRISFCWCLTTPVWAQTLPNKPFQLAIVEMAVTGFPLDDFVDPLTGTIHPFFENSAHIGIMTNVNRYWRVGLNYNYLWTRFHQQLMGEYFIAGLNARYERTLEYLWRCLRTNRQLLSLFERCQKSR